MLNRGRPGWVLVKCSAFFLLLVIFGLCLLLVKLSTGQRSREPEEALQGSFLVFSSVGKGESLSGGKWKLFSSHAV